jgi:hypothetical protein
VWNGPDKGVQGLHEILHFQHIMMNRVVDRREQPAVVDGAKWFQALRGLWDQARFALGLGPLQKAFQERRREARHIGGDHQVPIELGCVEHREESRQGAIASIGIGNDGELHGLVALRGADQSDVAGRLANGLGDHLNHGASAPGEPRLVATHSRALATRKNPAGLIGKAHEMMLTVRMFRAKVLFGNKKLYICSILALAASPMRASEPISVSAPGPERITFVVRVDRRTGKLVRTAVPSKPVVTSKPSPAISTLVDDAARANHVDPLLVHSVIQVESNYNQYAVSPVGAEGLMQLMPQTARMLGVNNSFDAKENIEAGVRYLKSLQDQFKDDRLALAAYNAGPNAVERYKWVPPFKETQKYVEDVGKRYGEARKADAVEKTKSLTRSVPAPPVPDGQMMAAQEERHPKLEQFVDQDGRLHLRTEE